MDSVTEYEKNAQNYLRGRDESLVGYKVVRQWANKLPAGSEVIEIACGGGYPVTRELAESGLNLWAIDSSRTLLTEFKKRFPNVQAKCERVQDSNFFDKTFDAAIAIGLVFLLPEREQVELIKRISIILNPGGQFLFTAPIKTGMWLDLNTGIQCSSLGYDKYQEILDKSGFKIISTLEDAGENNYYETERLA
jgi:cyclopropane fatty-acyl-phospholipid synthase-like methyltransferase